MLPGTNEYLRREYGIKDSIINASDEIENLIRPVFRKICEIREYNQIKVLSAFRKYGLSESHFAGTTGYGYGDRGRDLLDSVFAEVFGAEDAIVRTQIVSGTHALSLCLFGNLMPGDTLVSATAKPYDTLCEVIGLTGDSRVSLLRYGIRYRQVSLAEDGSIDMCALGNVIASARGRVMVLIQKSRGYSTRRALSVKDIAETSAYIRKIRNDEDLIIFVDNCYGEFTETEEPTCAGADLIAGSLIKNPGGGLAPAGGYIAGKKYLVDNAAERLVAPGLGKKTGPSLGNNRLLFQGLFMAPHAVAESLMGAVYCSAIMQWAGYTCSPGIFDERPDIIQSVEMGNSESLLEFCKGIQSGSPVDSHVTPVPWDMPGYDCPVIMAAGGFVQGASLELSADAPVAEPYTVFVQGGLVYENVKVAVMKAMSMLTEKGYIDENGKKC